MRSIKTSDLSKENLNAEHCEDVAYFEYLCEEASSTRGLAFFNIRYSRETHSIEIPDEFDFDEAIETVSQYLNDVEEDSDWGENNPTDKSNEYNDFTRDSRGADDGTFDYAGTFVLSILCVLQTHLKVIS